MAPLFDGHSESLWSRRCSELKLALSKARAKIKCNNCGYLMKLSEEDKITGNYWPISESLTKFYIRCFSCDEKVLIFNEKFINDKLSLLYEEYKRQPGVKISKKQFYAEKRELSYGFVNIV